MKASLGDGLSINWQYFSLDQVHSPPESNLKAWERPDGPPCRGIRAFKAAEAARRQGEECFISYHDALLAAKNERSLDIADFDTLQNIAGEVGLDTVQFQKDLKDPAIITRLAESHTFAVETIGIFGTPTLVFPGEKAVFLKLESVPQDDQCLPVFNEIRNFTEERPYLLEVKRP